MTNEIARVQEAQLELVATLAENADVFVDTEQNLYFIDAVNTEDGYFVAVMDGEEFTIEFAEVDLETECFKKLTVMNPDMYAV